ncbi:MAG: dihydropteroate synthase [Chloroflexi bacterium]|nr:dihydropteroate synthase [Chloroflexota bacterium]MCI0576049.1 dihydropteroate synthase [Chloroflexota bacterium]MCI0647837.1 dihydropteroate synthase [Chloroflexota bacterium]MCI0727088.1 dihydropteroate synthase [Chloroflexota bacterium]
MTNQVFLALGSNLGQRQRNLDRAIAALGEIMVVQAVSPVYETAPWGVANQPDFLNLCLGGTTTLEPRAFLAACKEIERELGRAPGVRWGSRLIDIDLLFYDDLVLDEEQVAIPHPGLAERAFVLVPLADIAPDMVDPRSGRTIIQLLADVDTSAVRRAGARAAKRTGLEAFAWGARTYVMGILNVTPDSFSGDGLLARDEWLAAAVGQAQEFVAAGADILDVGGESTRPGSVPVTAEEELARVIPVITAVRQVVDVPISVDSYRAAVAEAALAAGADWVNDVWGLRMDPAMAGLVARVGCPVVIMHNRSKPKNVEQAERLGGRYVGVEYEDLMADVRRELQASIDLALGQGVKENQIIIDPGIGFGKTVEQSVRLLDQLDQFKPLGYPILVGPSRKSFIGYTLDLPPEERLEGTAATVAIAIDRGADIVRVHDVKAMVRVARMTDRIVRR